MVLDEMKVVDESVVLVISVSESRVCEDECGRDARGVGLGHPDMVGASIEATGPVVSELRSMTTVLIETDQAAPDRLPFLGVTCVGPSSIEPD